MPEEYKIDYTGIQVPDIESVKKTAQQFTDWRRSMGFQTEEEKNAALKAEMQAAQQRFNDQNLWNSEDPYEVYNTYEIDPAKQAEFQRNGQMVAGVGSTIATLPFTAGMMGGWTPAIVSTVTGAAGGQAGAYGGQKLGQYINNKYGTNLTPGLTFAGGLIGGMITGGLGYKGWEGATNQYNINKAFKSGQLKWGQPTSYTAYHQSVTPITKFKFPFKERWDVRTHGADPNGAFFTVGKPAGSGFLAERPYTGQFQVKVQKPLIQTGELTGPTKNGLRNAIVRRTRKNGADAVFFDGIADNQLQNQQILFAMDNADIGYRGMISTPFKQGNWQLAKGVRNPSFNGKAQIMWMGPTAGKTTYSKINPNVIDIDPLTKGIRKQVAKKLGLNFRDPAVSATPEYQEAIVNDLVRPWLTDPANRGKTLVASTKHLLDPKYKIKFANEPFIPDFETFVARNQARGFRETPEQLRKWYDSILEIKPDIKIDNRFASEILSGK